MIVSGPPCTDVELCGAQTDLGVVLPASIRQLFEAGDGRYSEEGQWFVVWRLADLARRNPADWASGHLPKDLLAFGDDGAGDPFCMRLDGSEEVVRWSMIDLAPEHIFRTFEEFSVQWLA